jgi:hypothetical protein
MSWIVRQSHSGISGGNGNKAGLSGGPVYGFLNQFAQVSDTQLPKDLAYTEPYGYGAEGPDDGYDPFGYGDQGYGYGYAQF